MSPFCWQLHRPAIVVPDLLLDFPVEEQRAVLNHELVHLSAQHPLRLFLQRIVEALFWFHPLVWWSSRQAAAAREFRCDAQAVDSQQEVAVYLQSLLRLIEARSCVADGVAGRPGVFGRCVAAEPSGRCAGGNAR